MKKRASQEAFRLTGRFPLPFSDRKEREALRVAVEQADGQCEKLGLLDPTETEPALLYSPLEQKK